MLTIAWWKEARRVDHVKVTVPLRTGAMNVRVRWPTGHQDLKAFDQPVTDWRNGQVQDKLGSLSELWKLTYAWLSPGANAAAHDQKHNGAVTLLQNEILVSLSCTLPDGLDITQQQRWEDYLSTRASARAPMEIPVFVVLLMPAKPDKKLIQSCMSFANAQIEGANGARGFKDAKMKVANRTGGAGYVVADLAKVVGDNGGHFDPTNLKHEANLKAITTEARKKFPKMIPCVIVPEFIDSDVGGYTVRERDEGRAFPMLSLTPPRELDGSVAKRPKVVSSTVLAHELGHVLCGWPGHTGLDQQNLMTDGQGRQGARLSEGQAAWMRANLALLK